MKTKKLIILSIILIVGVAALLITNMVANKEPKAEEIKFFPDVTEASIQKILIKDNSNTSVLVRKPSNLWYIQTKDSKDTDGSVNLTTDSTTMKNEKKAPEFRADSGSVATVLEKINSMKKGELISQNPDRQSYFEVDSAKGVMVQVFDNSGSEGIIYIGKTTADWGSHFVRMKGSDKVYSVGGSVKHSFFTDPKRWRDKTISKFSNEDALKVVVNKKGGSPFTFTQAFDSTGNLYWNLIDKGDTIVPNKPNTINFIEALGDFKTNEWQEEPISDKEMGFTSPEMVIKLNLKNGVEKTITIGNKKGESKNFFVKISDKPESVFLVTEYTIDKLDHSAEYFDDN